LTKVLRALKPPIRSATYGSVYRLGVALHDLQNPAKIIGVGDPWILQPEDPVDITGYVHNVVFTCGATAEPDGTAKIIEALPPP
jgi:predicted GH43/DUF377 family glycosyl hydrolase